MLPKPYDHQEYLRQIHSSEAVAAMVTSPNAQVRELWGRLLRLVAAADPSSFHPAILSWYAPIGRPPKDPYRIMRSLLLMIHLGCGSVREWYLTLHHSPALAALCGWSADEPLPAIGTFYMFSHRTCQTIPCRGVVRRKQRRIKGTKGEKVKPRRPQVVSRLLERYRRHPPKPPFPRWLSLWAKVLAGSLERGLLGNLNDVFYVGDGSPVPSGASGRGHKTCDHGREPCDCPRRYADPIARFGWDSNRECTFFGRHMVTIAALGPCGPLPLYPRFYQGNRHDGLAFFCAQEEMFQILPGRVRLTKLAHYSAADILAVYQR
ncbi:MAG: transposase [Thermaerobacter sp.]|nr:transposase [Thermaerobacter sp.]